MRVACTSTLVLACLLSTRLGAEPPAKLVGELQTFYAELYGKALKDENRLARLIGVMSLSRIDGEPLTKRLVDQLDDADPVVAQLVWEALHARQSTLSPEQRKAWLDAGLEISKKGGFPGSMMRPVIAALASRPAEASKNLPDFCVRFAEQNDPATPLGAEALEAARAAIAAWQDPKLSQQLLSRLASKPKLAPRLAMMLRGLPGAPQEADASKTIWMKFSRDAKLQAAKDLPGYTGVSTLFSAPETITDPTDAKWKKELELGRLKVTNFDLVFCVDATGSMETSNAYVSAYIETITRMFHLMAEQARAGAVYYRHEIDPAIQIKCCRETTDKGDYFHVRTFPLTNDPAALVQQMLSMKLGAKGTGHNGDGAYAAGMATAMGGMQWSPKATRVIVVTGDARKTQGSDAAMITLAKKAKENGFVMLFVVRDDRAADETAPASREATGYLPIVYRRDVERLTEAKEKPANREEDLYSDSAFETAAIRVLELSLPTDYRNRAKPLMRTLLPILRAQDAARVAAASVK